MMTGRLYIDGNDAYKQYGVYVVDGGWNELVAMPPLKAVEQNDWQEEDGVEADLSDPVLNTREVQVKFAIAGLYSRFPAMVAMLSDGAYHDFDCAYIGRKFRLRLVSEGSRTSSPTLELATLKFADDFPLDGYTYTSPSSRVMSAYDYLIDGNPFTRYGVRVLQGSLAEVKKKAAVKPNLLRNIKTTKGALYDQQRVTYKSKDVKLTCLLRADSLDELWRNYDALLYDLIRPYEHVFLSATNEEAFYCFYKSCSVSEFFPDGKIWLKFSLTLTFCARVSSEDMKEALGKIPVQDYTEEARTRRERVAASVTEEDMTQYQEQQEELDDSIVLASEDDIIVFTEDDTFAVELIPGTLLLPSVRLVNDRMTLRFTGNGSFRFNN